MAGANTVNDLHKNVGRNESNSRFKAQKNSTATTNEPPSKKKAVTPKDETKEVELKDNDI